MPPEPKIAVYMICKDEASLIGRAVRSAADADQIVVCDTGSTDDTARVLEGLGCAALRVYRICVSPWRFDDARNAALSLVGADADYCVSLDADEVLAPGFVAGLRNRVADKAASRVNHSFETWWNWQQPDAPPRLTRHFHERIHARHGYRWVHPVHEKLVCRELETRVWCEELLIRQLPDTEKARSYLPLLEQAVTEDPKDWKLWCFLFDERLAANDPRAPEALQEALKLPDADRAYLYLRLGGVHERAGNFGAAAVAFNLACLESPTREACMARAEHWLRAGKPLPAYVSYLEALERTTETRDYMRREDAWNGSLERRVQDLRRELNL